MTVCRLDANSQTCSIVVVGSSTTDTFNSPGYRTDTDIKKKDLVYFRYGFDKTEKYVKLQHFANKCYDNNGAEITPKTNGFTRCGNFGDSGG